MDFFQVETGIKVEIVHVQDEEDDQEVARHPEVNDGIEQIVSSNPETSNDESKDTNPSADIITGYSSQLFTRSAFFLFNL